jgi:hypothetical protein
LPLARHNAAFSRCSLNHLGHKERFNADIAPIITNSSSAAANVSAQKQTKICSI